MARPGVLFRFELLDALEQLDPADAGLLFLSAMRYGKDETPPTFQNPLLSIVWAMLKPSIDADGERYAEKVLQTRYATYVREAKRAKQKPLSFEDWKSSLDTTRCHSISGDIQYNTNPMQSNYNINPMQEQVQGQGAAAVPPAPAPQDPKEFGFGPDLTAAFADWLKYKREKRQEYKPTGLTALVSQVRNNAAKYGEAAVAALIRQCMAANWQGIIWDKLEKPPAPPGGGKPGKHTTQDFQPTPERIQKNAERLDAFLAEQEGKSKDWNLPGVTRL